MSRASPSGRAGRASPEPASGLGHSATIPDAGNAGPDWFEVAKALAKAIMFQRATRREHVIGKDGRVRMGMVDLLGCYIVDDVARDFCELAGIPFDDVEAPTEHQAFYMKVTGRTWRHWFTDRDAIIEGAGPSPGRGKVDLKYLGRVAQGIEARKGEDADAASSRSDESPVANGDAPKGHLP